MTKENFKKLAILFSVVLNIGFAGSWLYQRAGMLLPAGRSGSEYGSFVYQELNLSPAQRDRLEPLHRRFAAFVNRNGQAITRSQLEFIDLLAADHPDRTAIDAKQAEIQELQGRMQKQVIAHILEASGIFSARQRETFFALIKGRIEKNSSPRPRWMPRPKTKSSPVEP